MQNHVNLLAWMGYLGIGIFAIVWAMISIFLLNSEYTEMLSIVQPQSFYPGENAERYQRFFFHPNRWHFLKMFAVLNLLCLGFGLVLWGMYKSSILRYLRQQLYFGGYLIHKAQKEIQRLKPLEKWILGFFFLGVFFYCLYKFYTTPKHQDEHWSYNFFVQEGFWVLLTYYPDTNNHIFFNIICYGLSYIFSDPRWIMKLPALLSFLTCLGVVFIYLLRGRNFWRAFLSISLSFFIYESRQYAYIGRGHLLLSVFVLLTSIFLIEFLRSRERGYIFYFTICAILGFYTIPSFVFHFMALAIFLIAYIFLFENGGDKKLWQQTLLTALGVIIGTTICYLPVILVSGGEALFANKWVKPLSEQAFWRLYFVFGAELFEYLLGVINFLPKGYLLVFPIGLWFLWVFFQKRILLKERLWYMLIGISSLTILGFTLYLKVLTPYRVFTYFIFLFHLALGFRFKPPDHLKK